MRSFLVGTLLPLGAIVLVALLEGALRAFAPSLSDRPVAFTDFSTIVQGVALLVAFFACGLFFSSPTSTNGGALKKSAGRFLQMHRLCCLSWPRSLGTRSPGCAFRRHTSLRQRDTRRALQWLT